MVAIISAVILNFTRAKYRVTQSIPFIQGTINYTLADLNIVAMYLDGSEIDTLPDGNYELTSESYCTTEDDVRDESITLSYDSATKGLSVSPMTKKGTKCYLYFEEHKIPAGDTILAHYQTVLTRTSFSSTITITTTGTIYKSANESQYDNDGEVYYFAGNPTDNWFQFGTNSSGQPLYWRIVRINGDGSIRLIYNGTTTSQTGNSTMINTSQAFNSSRNNSMYVGYMYQSGQPHGLSTNSNIKTAIDNWYLANLVDEAEQLDGNAGFCGDRTPYNVNGTSIIEYGAHNRLSRNSTPSFKCSDTQDLYTTPRSRKGNGALKASNGTPTPIGLISADEVVFAGGVYGSVNSGYYLYNNAYCWTMSPFHFDGSNSWAFNVWSNGGLNALGVNGTYGVRPVINLKSSIAISGSGTTSDPFKVVALKS